MAWTATSSVPSWSKPAWARLETMVKRLARRAGITKRISPHSLRHSFITAALDAGVPLRDLSR